MKDKLGFEIPAHLEALWQSAETTGRDLARSIHRIKLETEKALGQRVLAFREINQNAVIELENVWRSLNLIIPYALCPLCEGDERRADCLGCRGRGFMSKFRYERCISQDVKTARLVRLAS